MNNNDYEDDDAYIFLSEVDWIDVALHDNFNIFENVIDLLKCPLASVVEILTLLLSHFRFICMRHRPLKLCIFVSYWSSSDKEVF